jgi:hypothetical protein
MVSLLAWAALATVQTRIGLAMNLPEGSGEAEYLSAMRDQIRMGLDGSQTAIKWDEYEQQDGKPLKDALGTAKFMGQDMLLTISVIDTVKRRMPVDVSALSWDDPRLLDRFDGFVKKIVPSLTPQVRWISLGNEVDGYLVAHPDETAAFLKFLSHGRALLHTLAPKVQVGVTTMWLDIEHQSDLLKKLHEDDDVAIFTYYPIEGVKARPTTEVGADFDQMLAISGSKPLLLQEIGYPSSAACASTESQQADFVREVFAAIDRHQERIAFASFFIESDLGSAATSNLAGYYGSTDSGFMSFLGSLGLRDAKGKDKPAWGEFRKDILAMKPIQ